MWDVRYLQVHITGFPLVISETESENRDIISECTQVYVLIEQVVQLQDMIVRVAKFGTGQLCS